MDSPCRRSPGPPPPPELPLPVQSLLADIALKLRIAPADDRAKQCLLCLGEEGALRLLQKISRRQIRNLSAYVIYMARQEGTGFETSPTQTRSPPSQDRTSELTTPQQSYNNGNRSDARLGAPRDSVLRSSPLSSIAGGAQSGCSSVVFTCNGNVGRSLVHEVPPGAAATAAISGEGRPINMDEIWEDAHEEFDWPVTTNHVGALGEVDNPHNIKGEVRPTNEDNNWEDARDEFCWPVITDHLEALGELEFTKAFLVLSYIGLQRLEDVISIEEIKELCDLPMENVESKLCQVMKIKNGSHFGRKRFDWKSNKTRKYHCYVDNQGNCTFEGPFLEHTNNHLQRVLGDDKVLQVFFAEESNQEPPFQTCGGQLEPIQKEQKWYNGRSAEERQRYHKLAKEGIFVGLRRYQFFVFKDGGKEMKQKSSKSSVRCYFVCVESRAKSDKQSSCLSFNKSIHEARCQFMHIHTVSDVTKYMKRFSLILSKTMEFEGDLSHVDIQILQDIPCLDEHENEVYDINGERLIHTDGTGFISEDLALQCPNLFKGNIRLNKGHSEGCPLLLQGRLFHNGYAVKGTFLVNKQLGPNTIQIRKSMIKVEVDKSLHGIKTINSLGICNTSYKPNEASLSRYLIALLNHGGVPKEVIIEVMKGALDDIQSILRNPYAALKVVLKQELEDGDDIVKMILCGIPLHEPFLQHQLKIYMRNKMNLFKEGKVPLEDCYYLMGTADPTGKLKPNQVCVILDHGQVSGKVLVYRNPGLHFGDIHVFNATYIEDLEKIVGISKFAIFFSTQGPRSAADELAGGDFDGDLYWVSMNVKLLEHFQPSEPWERPLKQEVGLHLPKPTDFSSDKLEEHLFEEFLKLRFSPSCVVGVAAESWLVFMDRFLTLRDECANEREEKRLLMEKMLKLINIYYDALDAPKTGRKFEVPKNLKPQKKPHFMKKVEVPNKSDDVYISTSILGDIYELATSSYDGAGTSQEIWTIPCFENEIVKKDMKSWRKRYDEYRQEMSNALSIQDSARDLRAKRIIQKYKQILYDAPNLEESTKSRPEILKEACAIYHIVYKYAQKKNDVSKCSFAWRIAGEALCELYASKQQKQPWLCDPSVLNDILKRSLPEKH